MKEKKKIPEKRNTLAESLLLEDYREIVTNLSGWRIDDYIRMTSDEKYKKNKILPFIRGLKLSAKLIYAIRKQLSGTNIEAAWGHLMKDDEWISRECDIVIYDKRGLIQSWNGSENRVMDFKFVNYDSAKIVVSCKSFLRSGDIDKDYCADIKKYAPKVWLIAECCHPSSLKTIREKASSYGYDKFFYLYSWNNGSMKHNEADWHKFVKQIKKVVKKRN